jgi:hypothetical protein
MFGVIKNDLELVVEQEMQRNDNDEHDDDSNNYLHRWDFFLGDEWLAATAAMSHAVLVLRSALSARLHGFIMFDFL